MLQSKKFPEIRQLEQMDCGPTCLQIISKHYDVDFDIEYLRNICDTNRNGSTMLSIYEGAKTIQLKPTGIQIAIAEINEELLPCIAYWNSNHFVVLYKVEKDTYFISDPAIGLINYTKEEFLQKWSIDNENGYLLILETTDSFFEQQQEKKNLVNYAIKEKTIDVFNFYKKDFLISFALLFFIALLQFAFPIITQQLVDNGIYKKSITTIWILLAAQFAFFIGKVIAEIINAYFLLKLGNNVNLEMIVQFFDKLFQLPLQYFNAKRNGDLLQRITDHHRVQSFITNNLITILITASTIFVFSAILLYYNFIVFLVFALFTILYMLWFQKYMKQRAILDYKNFSKLSERQDKNLELINAMIDIKLNDATEQKKKEWENVQKQVHHLTEESLKLNQFQYNGAAIINEVKNIIITFLAAYLVIINKISFGQMLAITYIVGQLNGPIQQILQFLQNLQDAKLSLRRIQEVHNMEVEESKKDAIKEVLPGDINIDVLTFWHGNYHWDKRILKHLLFTIPHNKMTAIVGASGCGKSTFLKVLINYYKEYSGAILINKIHLKTISPQAWRKQFSVVMQENYIFNDTIINNICINAESFDLKRFNKAIEAVLLSDVLDKFPMGLHTKIGSNGVQISGGEKQRILLARALYKDAHYLFLDEATSNLDAIAEYTIMQNIQNMYHEKTIVVIAHRLSSIKSADQIVVFERGFAMETGTHESLMNREDSTYRELISMQQ